MSDSSTTTHTSLATAPTEDTDISTIAPPEGWTNKEACMDRSDWVGNPDDIKDMMSTDYGLEDAEPIWRHDPKYGGITFIFKAKAAGKTSYYVWNGIESSVCRLVPQGLGEIRRTIHEEGGYLRGLEQVPVEL